MNLDVNSMKLNTMFGLMQLLTFLFKLLIQFIFIKLIYAILKYLG